MLSPNGLTVTSVISVTITCFAFIPQTVILRGETFRLSPAAALTATHEWLQNGSHKVSTFVSVAVGPLSWTSVTCKRSLTSDTSGKDDEFPSWLRVQMFTEMSVTRGDDCYGSVTFCFTLFLCIDLRLAPSNGILCVLVQPGCLHFRCWDDFEIDENHWDRRCIVYVRQQFSLSEMGFHFWILGIPKLDALPCSAVNQVRFRFLSTGSSVLRRQLLSMTLKPLELFLF